MNSRCGMFVRRNPGSCDRSARRRETHQERERGDGAERGDIEMNGGQARHGHGQARYEQRQRQPRNKQSRPTPEEGEQQTLFAELLHIEVEFRRRGGETPRAADYLPRFPSFEAVIRSILPESEEFAPVRMETVGHPSAGMTVPGAVAGIGPLAVPGYQMLEAVKGVEELQRGELVARLLRFGPLVVRLRGPQE